MMGSDVRGALWHAPVSDRHHEKNRRARLRALLAALAEIDHAYATDLDTVRTSGVPVEIKQDVINTLRQKHQEHRAPLLQELQALQTQGRGGSGGASRRRRSPS